MDTLIQYVNGRILPLESLPFDRQLIDRAIADGHLQRRRGVVKTGNRYTCQRCLNTRSHLFETYRCAACDTRCTYCVQCVRMGRISSCTFVVTAPALPLAKPTSYTFAWTGTYSPLQRVGAEAFVEAARHGTSHLLYAVCGAGKTEMMFAPIDEYVKRGCAVAVVSPRVDVILELAPRFEDVFRGVPMQVLYGDAPTPASPFHHPITLATTHQLYRYERAFDAIFVDEADAFPYTFDETLRRAVAKAKKDGAPVHAITATPTRSLKRRYRTSMTTIPSRFHGHPLPLPSFRPLYRYQKALDRGALPRQVVAWITDHIENGRPFLLFFPSIETLERVRDAVQRIHPTIECVHAEHPERKEIVQQLRAGERVGLCTTTILERGVTIPNVQVAVLGAEQPIFTEEALIQIGGRVGRSADNPTGDFVLYSHGTTRAMKRARREIRRLNDLSVEFANRHFYNRRESSCIASSVNDRSDDK